MCRTLGKLMGLSVGVLVSGLSSVACAQGVWRAQGCSLRRAGYYPQGYRQAATYFQPSMANPTYMNHYVGRAGPHNAYQQARLQGMYVRLQQERIRGEIVRVKRQNELERRYASLKEPGSSQRSASTSTAATPAANNGHFLNQQDVTALREHYSALEEIHLVLNEHISRRNSPPQPTRPAPNQFDRESGKVNWPAMLTGTAHFREDLQHMNELLAAWAQGGHDPTSPAAIQLRKMIGLVQRDLAAMFAAGHVDQTAYRLTRDFLKGTAYETQLASGERPHHLTDSLASTY